MGEQSTADLKRICVEVAKDGLTAALKLGDPGHPKPLTTEEILEELKRASVVVDDSIRARIEEFLCAASGEEPTPDGFVVARGTPAKEGKDEEFVWDPIFERNAQDWQADAPVNYYTINSIVTVEGGDTIGTITPQVPAQTGLDVCGSTIQPSRTLRSIELDSTVQRAEGDRQRIVARIPGRVVFQANKLSIDKVFDISGDVDFTTSNVDSTTDVFIKGIIRDRFEVYSKKMIAIGGAIEAATVHADGDVIVRGGILCRHSGRVSAGGDIIAKFCSESQLHANGDIKITSEIIHCRTYIEGALIAEHGAVIGGHLYAKEGATIGTVGSDAEVLTRIATGIHPKTLREAAQIDEELKAKREMIDRIRQQVQPFLKELKRLTTQQRKHVAEQLSKADEAEATLAEAEQRRDRILAEGRASNPPRVLVSNNIYPGVAISIGTRMTTFQKEMKGPVTLEKRKVHNVTEFVAVGQLTGSIQVLPSMHVPMEKLMEGFEDETEPERPEANAFADETTDG